MLKFAVFLVFIFSLFVPSAFAGAPPFNKVMIIVLENTDFQVALQQPFLGQIAKQGALFTNFSAVTHPSQPNYVSMIAGDTMGVTSDSPYALSGDTIADLLEKNGKTWKVYAEDYPGNCFLGTSSGKYARKHVPFLSFTNIQTNPARCANVVNASELPADIAQGTLPDYSLFIPNLNDDGHDTRPAFADQYLSQYFGPKIQNAAFMNGLLMVFTFDEAEGNNPFRNQIYTAFYGPNVIPGSQVQAKTGHFDVLRTIEEALGLDSLNRKDASARVITGIWK